jgi:hypothetical protein
MAGLFDHLSSLIARFRGKQDPSPADETASVAARRLGVRSQPAPSPVKKIAAGSANGAIADLRHAMAEADKRQARTDTDASLLLAVLLTKGHGLSRAQALQLHDDLSKGGLREADRKTLRALYRKMHGREFTCRVPAALMD